jgi:hypothetical protein
MLTDYEIMTILMLIIKGEGLNTVLIPNLQNFSRANNHRELSVLYHVWSIIEIASSSGSDMHHPFSNTANPC